MIKQLRVQISIKYFSLIVLIIASCQTISPVKYSEGYSQKGFHSRGIDFNSERLVFTGAKGAYTVFDKKNKKELYNNKLNTIGDLRGVYLFSNHSFIAISSAKDAQVFYVTDSTSQLVFEQKEMFLDGVDFWEGTSIGIVYGDPINDKFSILKTEDKGLNWRFISPKNIPLALKNEAGFAASGTGIQLLEGGVGYIGTGISEKARLMKTVDYGESWRAIDTPIKSGGSFGIYSLNFWNENNGVIIGGSYEDTLSRERIAYITEDGGLNWDNISGGLPGYMSCIQSTNKGKLLICTGRLGTYYSIDKGRTWRVFTTIAYYTVKIDKNKVYFSGKNGSMAIYQI